MVDIFFFFFFLNKVTKVQRDYEHLPKTKGGGGEASGRAWI